MKNLICGVLIFAVLISLVACADIDNSTSYSDDGLFVTVHETNKYSVLYDKQTKVMYVMSAGYYNSGTFTMLVEADGSPKIWRGE